MVQGWAIGILEYMAQRTGCSYLSDLRYLSGWEQFRLSSELRRIPAEAFPLEQWNDSLNYFTGLPPADQASEAKQQLIQFLAKKSVAGAHHTTQAKQGNQ